MSHRELDGQLRRAAVRLADAGVPSPRADAELLAAHVLGISRGELAHRALMGHELDDESADRLEGVLAERARRIPLQHLVGSAPFRSLELRVGPGVFVPRPETECVVDLVLHRLSRLAERGARRPRVVDLGTGSGAIAAAVAVEFPAAELHAVELSEEAAAWAELNFAALPQGSGTVTLHRADLRAAPELLGEDGFDVVVSNPPYIPAEMVPREPEVAEHDPDLALYGGGADGLELPTAVLHAARLLLRPGGHLVMEHAELQAAAIARRCEEDPMFTQVAAHQDLSGRNRATSAVLRPDAARDVEECPA